MTMVGWAYIQCANKILLLSSARRHVSYLQVVTINIFTWSFHNMLPILLTMAAVRTRVVVARPLP